MGCTKRETNTFPWAVQSKTELFKKLSKTRKADEEDQAKEHIRRERSLLGASTGKVMQKGALRDIANYKRKMCPLFSRWQRLA